MFAHAPPQSPVPFFQSWTINATSNQLMLCNTVQVPVGISKLALPDADPVPRFHGLCPLNETLCATSSGSAPGSSVTMQLCVAGTVRQLR